MSYDINIYFRSTETGKMINPYAEDAEYTSEDPSIQEKQYKRNRRIAKQIHQKLSNYLTFTDYPETFGVELSPKDADLVGIIPEFDGDLLTLYIHFTDLSISDEEHERYICDIVWEVSQEEDCIIDDPQQGVIWIPSRLYAKVKGQYKDEDAHEYKAKNDINTNVSSSVTNVGTTVIPSGVTDSYPKRVKFWRIFFIVLMIIGFGAKGIKGFIDIEKFEETKKQEIQGRYGSTADFPSANIDIVITLDTDYTFHRPLGLGEYKNLVWVIEDMTLGKVLLKRGADEENTYRYYRNVSGKSYRVYLEAFISGKYQRVSNIIEYSVP